MPLNADFLSEELVGFLLEVKVFMAGQEGTEGWSITYGMSPTTMFKRAANHIDRDDRELNMEP